MLSATMAARCYTACLLILSLAALHSGHARHFTRCQLSKELIRYNFPRSFITNWVCLVESESGRDTDKITQHINGSNSYGLFQINSKEMCKKGKKGGVCDMKCEDLLNEDLSDDVRCAKRVFDRYGFQAWSGWKARCKGKQLPDLSRC